MRKVLFIAYHFPPIGGSGVQRPGKFVKYLSLYGWQPYVVSTDEDPEQGVDCTLIEDLINSFEAITDSNLRLMIAGVPQVPEYTNWLASLSAGDDRITFKAKRASDEEVQVFFSTSDLVILSFASVLTSSSLVLAMSLGRPVVVPALGCMSDIVTPDVGWVYEPGNIAELTMIIKQAFDYDLDNMGHLARERIATYTWDDFVAKTLFAYGIG